MSDVAVVQMSGAPGAGKTSISSELVRHRRLVAIDRDIVLSAMLESTDGSDSQSDGAAFAHFGAASYGVVKALADDFLAQGIGVVIDSPCFYDDLLSAGQALAAKHGVAYRYIECVTEDISLLDARLRARPTLRSQRPSIDAPPMDLPADLGATGSVLFADWIANMKRPEDAYLRLDTTRPLDECVAEALKFLDSAEV
jgi:predicted kinase